MSDSISKEDIERVKLLEIVSKKGLKTLTHEQLDRLVILVEKKDYSRNKKTQKSKMKLLAKINAVIYDLEERKKW
ncbi:MAG: hypothetical protein NPMRIOTA_150025 [Nitrosopumilales archaeon]|nr:MAG: hypothetical protein NPMRIOTA_150025 [Nitrosopumilales archaeon]